MRNYGVTYTGGATVFIQELADAVEAAGLDALPLSCGYNLGGSAIPLDVVERAEALGFRPRRAYGMTECPTVSASLGDDGPDVRCVTDGRILPGVEVRVVDADGHDVGARRRGRVPRARAASACSATSTRSTPATASTPTAGSAAATSASSTHRNCITVTGRTKDVINRGGEKLVVPGDRGAAAPSPRRQRRGRGRRPAPEVGRGAGGVRDQPGWRRDRRRRAGAVPQGRGRRAAEDPARRGRGRRAPRTASGKVKKYELVDQLPQPPEPRASQGSRAYATVNLEMFAEGQALVGPAVGEVGVALLAEGGDALVDVVAQVHEAAEREAVVERLGQPAVALAGAGRS